MELLFTKKDQNKQKKKMCFGIILFERIQYIYTLSVSVRSLVDQFDVSKMEFNECKWIFYTNHFKPHCDLYINTIHIYIYHLWNMVFKYNNISE